MRCGRSAPASRFRPNADAGDRRASLAGRASSRLEASLDRLRQIADALDEAPPQRAAVLVSLEANRLVGETIVEHERDDESAIYPRASSFLPDGQALGAMSRAHREFVTRPNSWRACRTGSVPMSPTDI